MLIMRKLGALAAPESSVANDQELAAIFSGPLDADFFSAMRDMFPAARALSDANLMAVARQANGATGAC
jgi:hypothetical protein